MECDIHLFLEKWTNVDNPNCPKLDDKSEIRDKRLLEILDLQSDYKWVSYDNWYKESGIWKLNSFYYDRNYNLFSLLANVRNYDDISPIDYPRGIPKDASQTFLYICKKWDINGHSHSYFLLSELLKIDSNFWIKINAENFIIPLREIEGDPDEIRICFFFDS